MVDLPLQCSQVSCHHDLLMLKVLRTSVNVVSLSLCRCIQRVQQRQATHEVNTIKPGVISSSSTNHWPTSPIHVLMIVVLNMQTLFAKRFFVAF